MGERDEILGLEVAELYDWLQGLVRQHGIQADRLGSVQPVLHHSVDRI